MGGDMQIQIDRFVATTQAAQPPRVDAKDATPETARAFMEWMVSEGYDPVHLDSMNPLELERMYTAGPDAFDADEAQVQALLIVLGYAPGPIDGWYGPQTQDAVAQFQRDHGIEPADGTMTPETLEAMQAAATGETSATGETGGNEPVPGTAEYTGKTIGEAITAADSLSPAQSPAAYVTLHEIDAGVDDAVEADYNRLVDEEGMTPEQAREELANRYGEGTRSDQVMEASLSRLEQDGRIEGASGSDDAEAPAAGTREATDEAVSASVDDDYATTNPNAADRHDGAVNERTDAAVLAEYDALVASGVDPEQAREIMTERYDDPQRSVVEASFNRLEAEGKLKTGADGAEPGASSDSGVVILAPGEDPPPIPSGPVASAG